MLISEGLTITKPYLLITYTDGLGAVPELVLNFLKINNQYCKGVVASGNSNFGIALFATATNIISEMYGIPIVCKLDLRGCQKDYDVIQAFYNSEIIGGNSNENVLNTE